MGLAEPDDDGSTVPTPAGFPIAMPYPEVMRKGTSQDSKSFAKKKMMNAIVLCLNYLHLGRPARCPRHLQAGKPLNRSQWRVVKRLGSYLDAWIECDEVGPVAMGRTASKVESLEMNLERLTAAVKELPVEGIAKYFPSAAPHTSEGASRKDAGSVVGQLPNSSFSTFKPIEPDRLKFGGRPEFDPLPFLDPISAEIYEHPLQCGMDPNDFEGTVPFVQVHCSPQKKIELFKLLDSSGRLALHRERDVRPRFASGLFAVTKNLTHDRMILDSRPSNLLEKPLQRWVKSLASAERLCQLHLKEDQVIYSSSNDLKDYYYYLLVGEERSRRNILAGAVRPKDVSDLNCFCEDFWEEDKIYGSLCTLAMGDCNAVSLAQTCHLSLCLQSGVDPSTLLTLSGPVPRSSVLSGIIIDDYVCLAKVMQTSPLPTLSSKTADRVQSCYESVKLVPNKEKGTRDEAESTFWGTHLDGVRGFCRGALTRAIPLLGIVLQICALGHSTVELLQVITGSLISLFLYRRRMMSLLDSVFQSCVGRAGDAIVKLSGRTKGELLICGTLLPLACTNLRAAYRGRISATDASDRAEAGVVADVPPRAVEELSRHTLRKAVWTKLLPPGKAWERSHGMLDASFELPEGEGDKISTNPLWEALATGLKYRNVFLRKVTSRRHINIGELRAFLRMELILGLDEPCSRELFGLDSQVVLGAAVKGRSSSPSLNWELAQSLPNMLGLELYSELCYFESALNPADDPTRGRPLREPRDEMPPWWADVCTGIFEKFDLWLEANHLGPHELSGLPDFAELDSQGSAGKKAFAEEALEPFSLHSHADGSLDFGSFVESGNLPKATNLDESLLQCGKAEDESEHADSTCLSVFPWSFDEFAEKFRGRAGKLETEEARECFDFLSSLQQNQVHLPPGLDAIPLEAGYLDLFSGEKGIVQRLSSLGFWGVSFEILDGLNQDLYDPSVQKKIHRVLRLGLFWGLGASPVCRSFSVAITPPVRTKAEPEGIANASPAMQAKILEGNLSAAWILSLLEVCVALALAFWVENPAGSWLFKQPAWLLFLEANSAYIGFWVCDYCRFKMKWRKRTKFLTNTGLRGCSDLCCGGHQHLLLRGRSKFHRKSWTLVAQPYPKGVVEKVARSMEAAYPSSETEAQGLGGIANTGSLRVGEAANPGPAVDRRQLLEGIPLISSRTQALQARIWSWFVGWLRETMSSAAVETLVNQPYTLVLLVKEFGNHLFSSGKSLYILRHLVVYVQKNYLDARPYMSICWDLVQRWETLEPPIHRTPLPCALLQAMVVVSLNWSWNKFAGILCLAFYGIMRPGEALKGKRRDLVLPEDLLLENTEKCYFRISEPKSRRRGKGRVQHASIHSSLVTVFLSKVFGSLEREQFLYPVSVSSFRRRWDAILKHIGIPSSMRITPGSLRSGGAVHEYHQTDNLVQLLWRMRLQHLATLENYVQEVAGLAFAADLPPECRRRVKLLSSLFDPSLSVFRT
eukprot:Skav211329  [mRNA]  locus=scaffold3120:27024:31484:+ [translate_table: standard]